MKTLTRNRLAWAALAVALVAGSLVAQDNDPVVQKTRILGEAIKAREDGNLQVALEKYEQLLQLDPKDEAANEGKLSVKATLAEADAQKARVAAAQKPATLLDAVAVEQQNIYAEVERAIAAARQEAAAGNHKRALEILDGANSYLPNNTAAQKVRDAIAIARQEINLRKEAGDQGPDQVAREEVVRLAKANAAKIDKGAELIDQAESLARKGASAELDEAVKLLDEASKELPVNIAAKPYRDRIKQVKGYIFSQRAFIAFEDREMNKADSHIRDYEKLFGVDDASAKKLRLEFLKKKADPSFRSVDEISPASAPRTPRSRNSSSRAAPVTFTATTRAPLRPTAKSSSTSRTMPSRRPTRSASARSSPRTPALGIVASLRASSSSSSTKAGSSPRSSARKSASTSPAPI